ncbi:replication protein A 70 kDa DNA-binding subunit B-like protein [Tanacetum coccineum]
MDNIGVNFIDQISTSKDSWKLKVRILWLWKQPFQLDMILMDEKGRKIQATIKKMLIPNFEMLLQEGSIIILSKFGIAENNGKYPVIKHQYKLNFYRNTIVKKSLDFQGPVFGFHFVSFDNILNNEAGFDFSVDVIGHFVECGDINVFSRIGKESKRISLQLENVEYKISCTLWDNHAQDFATFVSTTEGFVIIIIQFRKVHLWNGNPTVQNALFSTRLFLNEDVEEINEFKRSQTVYTLRDEFLTKYPRKYVRSVLLGTICVLLGTIKDIQEEYGWDYIACRKCNKNVVSEYENLEDIDLTENEGDNKVIYCNKCKTKVTSVVPRFRVNVRVQDATGTISLVLFDREVYQMTDKHAFEIREKQEKDGDVDSFPEDFNKLINKKFIFKIEVSDFNIENGYDVYTVSKVCHDAEIMDAMIKRDSIDKIDQPSIGCLDSKDVVSCTGDYLAATDIDSNSATSPARKHLRDIFDKDILSQSSSTKQKLMTELLEVVNEENGKDEMSVKGKLDESIMEENCSNNCKDPMNCQIHEDGVIDEQILKPSNNNVDVVADINDDSQLENSNGKFFSYVKAVVTANNDVNRSLFEKPIKVDGDGNKFMIFDDTIINEGCKRMWGRKDFKDVVAVTNGMFFMKIFSEEGMESVVNSGPWMVNNKPFFVQKWDIHVCLDKREPTHIPIWVRLCNIPLEAWTTKGINALASRLGKPLIMDNLTTKICKKGVGRVKYARVLVKVPTNKCFPDEIEVIYRDKDRVEICRKKIIVKFNWLPLRCSNCCVFGHDLKTCGKIDHEKIEVVNLDKNDKQNKDKEVNDDFTRVRNRKDYRKGKKETGQNLCEGEEKLKSGCEYSKRKACNNGREKGPNSSSPTSSGSVKRAWNVQGEILEAIKRSSNKYTVLEDQECENQKEAKEGIKTGEIDPGEINDVYYDENGIAQGMEDDVIKGRDKGVM